MTMKPGFKGILTSAFFILLSFSARADGPFQFDVVTGKCRMLWSILPDSQIQNIGGVVAIHDTNRDGIRDLIITGNSPESKSTTFRLISGHNGSKLRSYSVPASPYIAGTADFNGDARTDLLLVAYISKTTDDPPSSSQGHYRITVVDAETGRLLWQRSSPKREPDFGTSISASTDLNQDHNDDALVISMTRDTNGTATPFLILLSGKNGKAIGKLPAPEGASSFFGAGLASNLLDDDAKPDYVISDILFSPAPTRIEARAWAISGATGKQLWTRTESTDSLFGDTVVPAPDLNGDGTPDFIFAAPNDRDFVRGTIQAINGRNGKKLWTAAGRVLTGQFGRSVITMPDLNGDEVPEIAAGAPAMLPPMLVGGLPGHFQILSGATGKVLTFVKEILPSGMSFSSQFGMNLAGPGDLNRDGFPDIVVSAPRFGTGDHTGLIVAFSLK